MDEDHDDHDDHDNEEDNIDADDDDETEGIDDNDKDDNDDDEDVDEKDWFACSTLAVDDEDAVFVFFLLFELKKNKKKTNKHIKKKTIHISTSILNK